MKPLDLAFKYMSIFYSNTDITVLRPILADKLIFEGPLFQFDSAEAYLDSFRDDERVGLSNELIQSFQYEQLPSHGIKVAVVPQAGHGMMWDNPAGFAEVVASLLAE